MGFVDNANRAKYKICMIYYAPQKIFGHQDFIRLNKHGVPHIWIVILLYTCFVVTGEVSVTTYAYLRFSDKERKQLDGGGILLNLSGVQTQVNLQSESE